MRMGTGEPSREPLVIDHKFVTVPVDRDVRRTMHEWVIAHREDLAKRLAHHGMSPCDLEMPGWQRLAYVDGVAGHGREQSDLH